MTTIVVKQPVAKEVKFLQAVCGVRYWDDATVNGAQEDEDEPTIPFAISGSWRPLIDIDTGVVIGWPQGTTADIHYKVCDDGEYTLLDADMNVVTKIDGYVPKIMCPEGNGYGDYVIMKIDADGKIANWTADLADFERDAS